MNDDEMTFNVNDTDFTISERLKDFSDMVEEQIDVDNIPDDDDGEDDDTGFRM
ncbi:hypothetical protein ACTOI6_19000 (plasmid) [Komagataeibacter intermedius]|uniref:hypothetical protein n=1 Tax=Komagataeibacter intermedius TaxID=66229 RepID=UPI0040350CD8